MSRSRVGWGTSHVTPLPAAPFFGMVLLAAAAKASFLVLQLMIRLAPAAEPSALERLKQERFERRQELRERRQRDQRIRQLSGDWGRTVELPVSDAPKGQSSTVLLCLSCCQRGVAVSPF